MSGQQQAYWDNQTQQNEYCTTFLKAAEQNKWIIMFEKSLKQIDTMNVNRVLEVGGGSQLLSRFFCTKYPEASVVCTDISKERIQLFQNFYDYLPDNLTLLGGINAEALPFRDGEFDLIFGDAVVSHFEDLKRGLIEVNRCLRKGGFVIFIREPVIGAFGVLAYQLLQLMNKERPHVIKNRFEFKRLFSQWKYEFIMAGFKFKVAKGWSTPSLAGLFRSTFPRLFPCWTCFILQKKFDFKENDKY